MSLSFVSYPNPVNEVTARVTAGGVVILAALALALQLRWLAIVLAAGFLPGSGGQFGQYGRGDTRQLALLVTARETGLREIRAIIQLDALCLQRGARDEIAGRGVWIGPCK